MRIILDTSALYRPRALMAVAGNTAIVPAVVYMERVRQLKRDGRSATELDSLLQALRAKVEDFTRAHAAAIVGLEDAAWRRLSRDAMVACHVGPNDLLWTANASDFLEIGLRPDQVVSLD